MYIVSETIQAFMGLALLVAAIIGGVWYGIANLLHHGPALPSFVAFAIATAAALVFLVPFVASIAAQRRAKLD